MAPPGANRQCHRKLLPCASMVKVKTWGKSPRLLLVTIAAGKPCMLKCHVYRWPRAARPIPLMAGTPEGRQNDPGSNDGTQINDSIEQNPAYGLVVIFVCVRVFSIYLM